jgi:hypothetical protein
MIQLKKEHGTVITKQRGGALRAIMVIIQMSILDLILLMSFTQN